MVGAQLSAASLAARVFTCSQAPKGWSPGCSKRAVFRLHEAEAILDEAVPELTSLRALNADLAHQVRRLRQRLSALFRARLASVWMRAWLMADVLPNTRVFGTGILLFDLWQRTRVCAKKLEWTRSVFAHILCEMPHQ